MSNQNKKVMYVRKNEDTKIPNRRNSNCELRQNTRGDTTETHAENCKNKLINNAEKTYNSELCTSWWNADWEKRGLIYGLRECVDWLSLFLVNRNYNRFNDKNIQNVNILSPCTLSTNPTQRRVTGAALGTQMRINELRNDLIKLLKNNQNTLTNKKEILARVQDYFIKLTPQDIDKMLPQVIKGAPTPGANIYSNSSKIGIILCVTYDIPCYYIGEDEYGNTDFIKSAFNRTSQHYNSITSKELRFIAKHVENTQKSGVIWISRHGEEIESPFEKSPIKETIKHYLEFKQYTNYGGGYFSSLLTLKAGRDPKTHAPDQNRDKIRLGEIEKNITKIELDKMINETEIKKINSELSDHINTETIAKLNVNETEKLLANEEELRCELENQLTNLTDLLKNWKNINTKQ